jgi:hypothetical protein
MVEDFVVLSRHPVVPKPYPYNSKGKEPQEVQDTRNAKNGRLNMKVVVYPWTNLPGGARGPAC